MALSAYKWEFEVFASKEINAFSLPGGKIGLYRGILPITETEAGLAALLGHEIAHAVLRHGEERLSQNLARSLGLGIASLFLHKHKQKNNMMKLLGFGSKYGVLLPYSREHELEADRVGLQLMAQAGYNPQAALAFWSRMDRISQEKAEFLSTHPHISTRLEALRPYLPQALTLYRQSQRQRNSRLDLLPFPYKKYARTPGPRPPKAPRFPLDQP